MSKSVSILERFNWRSAAPGWLRLPGSDRVESFADRTDAEVALREREWDLRRRINPFHCGGPFLHYQSSFDAARLHDWFLDAGLEPPGPTVQSSAWAAMWDRDHASFTDAQRAAAWDALDRVRFFRIADEPPGAPMHLVARPNYEEDPLARPYGSIHHVGASPHMLVRTTHTANEMCKTLFVDSVAESGGYVGAQAIQDSWEVPEIDPFASDEAESTSWLTWHAEHRPLVLFAERHPTPGQTLYIVLRRHWRLEVPDDGSWRWSLTSRRPCGKAIAAYDTLAAADARIAGLEAEARTYPSPFRFGPPHEWGTLHASGIYGVLSEMFPIDFTNLWEDYWAQSSLWSGWWDAAAPVLKPDDIAFVWSVLYETLRFYEVVAVEYRE